MVLCASEALEPVTMAEAELRILNSVKGKVEDFLKPICTSAPPRCWPAWPCWKGPRCPPASAKWCSCAWPSPCPWCRATGLFVRANLPAQDQTGLATIGGGRILGVSNVRLRRKKPWTLSSLAARRDALDDPARWCELMLREGAPASARELESKCLLRPEEMSALLDELRANGRAVPLSAGTFTHSAVVEETAAKMLETVQAFHAANPQRAGLGRDELFSTVGGSAEVCELAAASLVNSQTAGTPGHRVRAGRLERPRLRPRPTTERPRQRSLPKRRLCSPHSRRAGHCPRRAARPC